MRHLKTLFVLSALGVVCLSACSHPARHSAATTSKETPGMMSVKEDVKATSETKEESPFACNMLALTPEGRTRHLAVIKELLASNQALEEISDGYAFRFESGEKSIMLASEFMWRERLCCPFLTFEMVSEREGGPLWLRLRGRDGVKEFIRAEFKLDG